MRTPELGAAALPQKGPAWGGTWGDCVSVGVAVVGSPPVHDAGAAGNQKGIGSPWPELELGPTREGAPLPC